MKTPAAEVNNLTKVYPVPMRRKKLVAVEGVSFSVQPGEVYGLLGPNGSGKSTTLKILLGLVIPNRGEARIFGKESRNPSSHYEVGFLPENPYFYKYLTAAETLRFFGKVCGMHGRKLNERVNELLKLVNMESAADRRVGGFSKGMLQRIGLAQALVQDPELLILDEPTAGVDPVGSRVIRDLILRLKEIGKTVLLTSHLLEQVQEVCDRVGIMANGRMVREGHLEDLVTVEGQTECVIEGNVPEGELSEFLQRCGAKLIETRKPRLSLERIFLEAANQQKENIDG